MEEGTLKRGELGGPGCEGRGGCAGRREPDSGPGGDKRERPGRCSLLVAHDGSCSALRMGGILPWGPTFALRRGFCVPGPRALPSSSTLARSLSSKAPLAMWPCRWPPMGQVHAHLCPGGPPSHSQWCLHWGWRCGECRLQAICVLVL